MHVCTSWHADLRLALGCCSALSYLRYYYGVVAQRPDTAEKVKATAKKVYRPVMTKFANEPILILGAIYNAVQVALCGYMMYGTVMEYMKQDYLFICNPFEKTKSGMVSDVTALPRAPPSPAPPHPLRFTLLG